MSVVTPAYRMTKAAKALESGRTLLEAGDADGACNRAYYAMFHAAHAALEVSQAIKPGFLYKTHSGLIAAFGQELVTKMGIDSRLGRTLSKVYQVRLVADYAGDPPDDGQAAWALDQADWFVSSMKATFFAR